jgi:hypothetical protein
MIARITLMWRTDYYASAIFFYTNLFWKLESGSRHSALLIAVQIILDLSNKIDTRISFREY